MANKKINELSSRTPALSDLMIVGDPSSGYSYKCTVTALATIIETDIADGYVTIGTTQTISGAKTFSNNLTLTSVANATTTQSKFLTLNGSNVVNYRTGAEVLSDIGGQASLSGTGLVKSTSGTISYITDNSSNWNTAYNDSIVSAAVSGTTTKTLTLTQQDGGTLTASWTDINTDAVTSVFGRTGAVVATEGDYTLTQLGDVTITTPSTGQVLKYNGTSWVNDTDANTGTVTSVALSTGTTGTDISVSGSPITSSGTITLNIPTASATNRGALSSTDWSTFNNKQSAISLTTTGNSGAATFVSNTLNIPNYTLSGLGGISGSGTTNYIPKFTGTSAIGNSQIFDNGTSIGIGTTSPAATAKLEVIGDYRQKALVGNANGFNLTINSSTDVVSLTNFYNAAMTFATNNTERMRLDASGNLLVGTTTAQNSSVGRGNLTIGGTSNSILNFSINGANSGYIFHNGSMEIFNATSNPITFGTALVERMRLTSAGELLINTTSDAGDYKLQVNGNTYGNGTAYFTGNIGIGVTPSADVVLYSTKALSGSVFPTGIFLGGIISGTSTSAAVYFNTNAITENTTFTLPHLYHYRAAQGTFGASSTVTNQYGFIVANSLTSATNNFAFYGDLAAATGRWNLYMNGTANNYMNGNLGIGVTTPTEKLEVNGAIKTAAPSGGTAKPWKLGEAGVTLGGSNTSGVRVEIDGVVYYLVTGYLP